MAVQRAGLQPTGDRSITPSRQLQTVSAGVAAAGESAYLPTSASAAAAVARHSFGDSVEARPDRHPASARSLVTQRTALALAGPPPAARPEPPAPGPSWGDSMQQAVASGAATLASDGSLVFTAPAGYHDDGASAGGGLVQRQAADESGGGGGGPPAGPTASASASPGAGAGAGTAPSGGGQSNEQLEQLAKNLYDKLRERLKVELRLDRERSGRLTDLA